MAELKTIYAHTGAYIVFFEICSSVSVDDTVENVCLFCKLFLTLQNGMRQRAILKH